MRDPISKIPPQYFQDRVSAFDCIGGHRATKIVFVGPQNEHLTLDPDDAGVGIKHSITEVKAKSIWGAVTVLMCMRVRHCVDEWVGGWVGVHRSARLCVFPRACVLVCLPCHVCGA